MDPVTVRRRLFLSPLGTESIEESAVCPKRGETVPLRGCIRCGHSSGVVLDPKRGFGVVDCDLAPPESATVLPQIMRGGALEELRTVTLNQVLTPDVVCASVGTPHDVIRRALEKYGISALPIVDADRKPVGIVSLADLLKGSSKRSLAGEIMSTEVITLHEESPATRAAAVMAFEGIHHIPVVDSAGALVGVVSSIDLLRFIGQLGGFLVPQMSLRQRRERGLD